MTSFKRFESKPVVKIIFSILFCLVARVVATKKKWIENREQVCRSNFN